MRNTLIKFVVVVAMIVSLGAYAQTFNITNTYVMTNVVSVVQTFNFGNMVPVVSSAGSPLTNSSRWAEWIPRYIDAIIYTNGLSTNNVTDTRVLWTARQNKVTFQERDIHQGMPDLWDGTHYIRLPLAKERILAGQRIHVLLSVVDNSTTLTNLYQATNVVWNASGVLYKVIDIPNSKPSWIP